MFPHPNFKLITLSRIFIHYEQFLNVPSLICFDIQYTSLSSLYESQKLTTISQLPLPKIMKQNLQQSQHCKLLGSSQIPRNILGGKPGILNLPEHLVSQML